MLDKKVCQLCCQKHEKIWDEEGWQDGFVDCPSDLILVQRRGKVLNFKSPEVRLLKVIYSMRKIDDCVPNWCESNHCGV